MGAAAAVIGAGAVVGGATKMIGAGMAAGAAKDAAKAQMQMFQQVQGMEQPFISAGSAVLPDLQKLVTGSPTGGGPNFVDMAAGAQPGQFTQAQLEMMPGYQWAKSQGIQSTQSSSAARGLGVSGAEMKGAANFATGLANQTYMNAFQQQQQRFANYLGLNQAQQGNLQNQYARLIGVAGLGQNAAGATAQAGTTLAGNQGNYLAQSGQFMGAGVAGVGSTLTGAANNYLSWDAYQAANNPNYVSPITGTSGMGPPGTFTNYQPSRLA